MEFALIFTIFIILLFGMIECGRLFSAKLVTTHAAREGARIGVVTASVDRKTKIENAVEERGASLGLTAGNIITNPPNPAIAAKGASLTVTVNYKVDLVVPIISTFFEDPYPISSSAVMRVE